MGASGSKAAQSGARKFPTRAPGSAPPRTAPRATRLPPEPRSQPQAPFTKSDAIRADSLDPQGPPEHITPAFAHRLKAMGVAQPNPTYSATSTYSQGSATPTISSQSQSQSQSQSRSAAPQQVFPSAAGNATLNVLESRRRLEEEADAEFSRVGRASNTAGREFLDVATIREALVRRQRGESAAEIESVLKLKPGVVARLGPAGLVSTT
ncbi:hypothetical protein B0T25DRAFT_337806 [Lasiosphaeria hispida]|uniref:Helix-turn-helix domain-containing protein n=1 Tax=Lasiosphaeria hispida TaxID=260671 RepID=A0AAJ0H622_9PEZI|nr:hypothetical protein B0T25DRAFT_337806 [Lasiosphaeria hispida]